MSQSIKTADFLQNFSGASPPAYCLGTYIGTCGVLASLVLRLHSGVHHYPMGRLCSLYLSQIAIMGVKKVPKLAKRVVKIQKYFACVAFMEIKW